MIFRAWLFERLSLGAARVERSAWKLRNWSLDRANAARGTDAAR